jgi:hypothetical protein
VLGGALIMAGAAAGALDASICQTAISMVIFSK